MCRLSWNLGAWTSWNPQGLSRPVRGLLYLSFIRYLVYLAHIVNTSGVSISLPYFFLMKKRSQCASIRVLCVCPSVAARFKTFRLSSYCSLVFLNRRAAARYRALASIIPGRERPEETTVCYKILLVQLITNLNVILYLSTCHTIYVSVLTLFMIMP